MEVSISSRTTLPFPVPGQVWAARIRSLTGTRHIRPLLTLIERETVVLVPADDTRIGLGQEDVVALFAARPGGFTTMTTCRALSVTFQVACSTFVAIKR